MNRLLLLGSLLGALNAPAMDLPPLILPQGVGVDIPFTMPQPGEMARPGEMDQIAAAGFRFGRIDLSWAATERERGRFDFSAYDPIVEHLRKRGLRAMLTLDGSNPLYEETVVTTNETTGEIRRDVASSQTEQGVMAFARWTAAAANHFRGRGFIWEIPNEPGTGSGKPGASVEDYLRRMTSACITMRALDPGAFIIAPGTSEFASEFLESFCRLGGLEYLDAVSVHPFRSPSRPPESAGEEYRQLRELLDRHAPRGGRRKLPIVCGEWGYSTHRGGVTPEVQANYAVRQQLVNLLHGIPISIWHAWKNDGTNPEEQEHNFGVVRDTLDPKPAYTALQTMSRELNGYRIERRVVTDDERDFILLLVKSSAPAKIAAWTIGPARTLSLAVEADQGAKVSAVTQQGETYVPKLKEGRLSLELSGAPQFATLNEVRLRDSTAGSLEEKE